MNPFLSCKKIALASAVCATLALSACNKAPEQVADLPAPAVVVTTLAPEQVTPSTRFVARTEAVEDVKIQARVSGYLLSRNFAEGQQIEKGTLLFEIDPKPYEVEVTKMEAEIKRNQAALTNAKNSFERGKELITKKFISAKEMDELQSNYDQAKAALAASEASLENAKVNLTYTKIVAPISGRVGRSTVSTGDLVGPDSGTLVSLVSIDPMHVTLDVSEKLIVSRRLEADKFKEEGKTMPAPIPRLILPNGTPYDQIGVFNFIDNRVDSATGTVKVRAAFPNPQQILVPGQYVTAIIESPKPVVAILVPQSAVSEDQQGSFVLTVDKEEKVQVTRVVMGERYGINWEVESGLNKGDRVIVEGLQKVRPGQKVQASEQQVKAFQDKDLEAAEEATKDSIIQPDAQ